MKITLEKNQRLFFTSDTHYNHSNICSATTNWIGSSNLTRQFNSLDHMNDVIVDNINNIVGENDVLIHLGDWSFGGFDSIKEFRDRIICKNIYLAYGNHDHHIDKDRDKIDSNPYSISFLDNLQPTIFKINSLSLYSKLERYE